MRAGSFPRIATRGLENLVCARHLFDRRYFHDRFRALVAGQQRLAVRGERHAIRYVLLQVRREQGLLRVYVPDAQIASIARRRDLAVFRDRDSEDIVRRRAELLRLLAAADIPYVQVLVEADRHELVAVRGKYDACHRLAQLRRLHRLNLLHLFLLVLFVVLFFFLLVLLVLLHLGIVLLRLDHLAELLELLLALDVPDLDGGVLAARGEPLAVRAEGDAVDRFLVSAEILDLLAVGGIPETDRLVLVGRARGEKRAVRAERDGPDQIGVAFQLADHLAVLGIPELDEHVLPGRREQRAVLVERDAVDGSGVPLERVQQLAALEVPKLHLVVEGTGGERVAVRADGECEDQRCVPFEFGRRLREQQSSREENERQGCDAGFHGSSPPVRCHI